MRIEQRPSELWVAGVAELVAANASSLRQDVIAALAPDCRRLTVDLSGTVFVDSSGLGVLISLHKAMQSRGGCIRVLNPAPQVRQILELTRLDSVFDIVNA